MPSISAATAARSPSSVSSVSLALGGELQSLQDRVLVRELVDDRLLERDLGARGTQLLAQLFWLQRVDVLGDHGV